MSGSSVVVALFLVLGSRIKVPFLFLNVSAFWMPSRVAMSSTCFITCSGTGNSVKLLLTIRAPVLRLRSLYEPCGLPVGPRHMHPMDLEAIVLSDSPLCVSM